MEPFSIKAFCTLSLYTLLLNLLFAAAGLLMSSMIKKAKPITTLSIGLVLILYFVFTFSKITESVSKIGYLTPFRYVNLDTLNPLYTIELWNLLYFISLSLLMTIVAFRIYRKKDIYI